MRKHGSKNGKNVGTREEVDTAGSDQHDEEVDILCEDLESTYFVDVLTEYEKQWLCVSNSYAAANTTTYRRVAVCNIRPRSVQMRDMSWCTLGGIL